MAGITFNHVYKIYDGGIHAVSDFSMHIEDKEFIAIVGPSGSGKTTVLRMIAGLEEITSGQIVMDGRIINNLPPKDRDIAMVFQRYALFPHFTVYDNIAIGLHGRGISREETDKRVRETAEFLGLNDCLGRKPNTLSGGQRQRVALGRAIVREPNAFLLDEPLSNLDTKLRTEMRKEILKIKKRMQTTFVYVTHDQTEAITMADRIVVMKEGGIQQIGTPREVYNHPSSRFVASFIGIPQMNFFTCMAGVEGDRFNIAFTGDSTEFKGKANAFESLRTYLNSGSRFLIMGIRADDIYLSKAGEGFIERRASVNFIEETGGESIFYCNICGGESAGKEEFTVKSKPGHLVKSGDIISVYFDIGKLHFFDSETEQNILYNPQQ